MRRFGLIGYPLSHSFSPRFFAEKFEKDGITDAEYALYPLQSIDDLPALLLASPDLAGLNVTIPYKETIISLLDEVDPIALKIGAVNVLKKMPDGGWKGYNSDYYGFTGTMLSVGKKEYWAGKSALIFGSGGSAKAVKMALESLEINSMSVSRSDQKPFLSYQALTVKHVQSADILVNCTPLGMHPNVEDMVPIPYEGIGDSHVVIDLIYNPAKTRFLEKAEERGAQIVNGDFMLQMQAEKAWEIWNSER